MNKSDLEKCKKCQEEYEKFLKESPLHSVIDEIAKDIRDRQDNIMAMEFARTIAELLRENGIAVHCEQYEDTEKFNGKSIEIKYDVRFDSVDCTEHDKKFTEKIEMLEENNRILSQELEIKKQTLKSANNESAYLKKKISELESELSVKENLLKAKNGLCREKSDYEKLMEEILSYEPTNTEDDIAQFNYQSLKKYANYKDKNIRSDLNGLTPIEVAEKLINAEAEYETNSIQRAFGAGEKEKYNIFSAPELRQIAEHLIVYCNHNSENKGEV